MTIRFIYWQNHERFKKTDYLGRGTQDSKFSSTPDSRVVTGHFKGFRIEEVTARHSAAKRVEGRKLAAELLIVSEVVGTAYATKSLQS